MLGVEDNDWLKKLSSSSVLNAALELDPLTTWVDVVLDVFSTGAVRKLVKKSDSDDGVLLGASLTGVSKNTRKLVIIRTVLVLKPLKTNV